ncbi:MAG: CYCXC family (seleno)protein [Candidatus Nitrospinota bacterium M3_3B_026]
MRKLFALAVAFTLAFSAGYALAQSRKLAAQMIQKDLLEAEKRVETRPTLDPAIFARDEYVASTYRIAKKIPDVLDKLFCYCYCAINPKFKHKSLLTCYTDEHAAQCGVCMREAVVAMSMTREGKKPEDIAAYLADFYLNRPH